MTQDEIRDRVRDIVIAHFSCDPAKVTDEAQFVADLDGDSLDSVEVVMELELAFDVEIPDDQAENLQTFGDAVKWLSGKLTQPA